MLTDDDLTRDLRAAFHDAADDLTYDGAVPTVRRTPAWAQAGWLALPAAAAAATVAVLVAGPGPGGVTTAVPPNADPATTAPPTSSTSSTPTAEPIEPEELALVTEEFQVAGFTISYQRHASEEPHTMTISSPSSVPAGARKVTFPGQEPERGWVGTRDDSDDGVFYFEDPDSSDGRLLAISFPGLDEDALIAMMSGDS